MANCVDCDTIYQYFCDWRCCLLKTHSPRHLKRRTRPLVIVITLLALALVVIGAATGLRRDDPPVLPEPVVDPATTPYIDRWGELLPGAKRNEYDHLGFTAVDNRMQYTGADQTVLTGVDVSDHNGAIDWSAVKGDGIDYAIVRVGYRGYGNGALVTDERFGENAAALEALAMPYGLYFFSQCLSVEEAREEARFVLTQLEGRAPTLPIYFDWEPISDAARTADMDLTLLTDCALAFCQTIEAAGFDAGIYFNQEFGYLHYNLITLKDYDLWLAEYAEAPSFYYHFHQWQYSCTGSVAGISTVTDLNLRFIPKEA